MEFNKNKALRRIFDTELTIEIVELLPCSRRYKHGTWTSTKGRYEWRIREGKRVRAWGRVWGKNDTKVEAYKTKKKLENI